MSISFFRITPTELQFIDNRAKSTVGNLPGTFGAEFHRERSYSVITALPIRAADTVVAQLSSQSVAAGDTIVRAGTPADKFLIIVDGEVELERAGEVTKLGPGELFGEVAIMRDEPRASTVTAKTDVKLLAIDRAMFRDLIAQAMEITPDFDQVIRARLDAQNA
jgi:CRP-like cAMP-binding protein